MKALIFDPSLSASRKLGRCWEKMKGGDFDEVQQTDRLIAHAHAGHGYNVVFYRWPEHHDMVHIHVARIHELLLRTNWNVVVYGDRTDIKRVVTESMAEHRDLVPGEMRDITDTLPMPNAELDQERVMKELIDYLNDPARIGLHQMKPTQRFSSEKPNVANISKRRDEDYSSVMLKLAFEPNYVFRAPELPAHVRVVRCEKEANKLFVEIKLDDPQRQMWEEEWNLEHTRAGFRNGTYKIQKQSGLSPELKAWAGHVVPTLEVFAEMSAPGIANNPFWEGELTVRDKYQRSELWSGISIVDTNDKIVAMVPVYTGPLGEPTEEEIGQARTLALLITDALNLTRGHVST